MFDFFQFGHAARPGADVDRLNTDGDQVEYFVFEY
jgi:hypothetical protein